MLDKVLMDDRRRRIPFPGHISPLPPNRLVQTSQARDHFATNNPWNFASPGSGLAIFWEAICHQSLGVTCCCLTFKGLNDVRLHKNLKRVYFRKVAGTFSLDPHKIRIYGCFQSLP